MKVSFIVPVKNEENSIAGVVEGIKKCVPAASEIIVIDDGSTDATAANASAAGARVISHNINMGKGCAIRTGIKAASGDVIVFIDGDGQDDPADAAAMLAEMERGFDFVNGSRFLGILEKGSITTLHRYGNIFMTSLINLLFSSKISDSQAGFRAVRLDKIRGW
ncbi:MAG: glycosyltransferase family 2 protein, partial [Deltaproteobacteria bacterium]|nr:glycosyltransferase family 2 protein [Deltaproteobacteria bacterium]